MNETSIPLVGPKFITVCCACGSSRVRFTYTYYDERDARGVDVDILLQCKDCGERDVR